MLGTGLKSFPYLGIKGYLSSTSFHLGFTFHPIAKACQVYERSVNTLKQRQWLDLRPHQWAAGITAEHPSIRDIDTPSSDHFFKETRKLSCVFV